MKKTDSHSEVGDPRCRSDFRQKYYPRANGKQPPQPSSPQRNDRIVLEFLAIYYALNCEYAELLNTRTKATSPKRSAAERKSMQTIETLLIARDHLEDLYAPFGVVPEPVIEDGFTIDVKFSFGNIDAAGKLRSELYTLTAYVPVPRPKGLRIEDLPIKIEGPGINPE